MRQLKYLAVAVIICVTGCGMIADKDRIQVAKIGDKYITRGDLFRIIRELPDDERPNIQNRGDLLRVLNNYLDQQIKMPLGDEVDAEAQGAGKVLVPRENAQRRFFEINKEYNYETIYQIKDPAVLNMTQASLDANKIEIELGIDKIHREMKADAAVALRAAQAYQSKTLVIEDAEYEREYRLRKDELNKLEWLAFKGIKLPSDIPGAESEAALVRKRIDNGEDFDAVAAEYAANHPETVLESEIENNPALERFRGFWLNATGCKAGDIIGPIYMPEYQAMGKDPQGRPVVKGMSDGYMVFKVLDHRPEETLPLEEAKMQLAPTILIAKFMKQLREKNGVEVYEDKLPDPAMISELRKAPM